VLAPTVLAVRLTVFPEAEALTNAPPSALIIDANAEAIDAVVVPDPLQLVESPWALTVIVQIPES
jgi:hypothetical protein